MSASADFDAVDENLVLTTKGMQLHVSVSAAQLLALVDIGNADWDARRSLQVGTTLGHPVFWCAGLEPGEATVLVGHDDETWELAVTLPTVLLHEIVRDAQAHEAVTSED